jgi:hypothetical protein
MEYLWNITGATPDQYAIMAIASGLPDPLQAAGSSQRVPVFSCALDGLELENFTGLQLVSAKQ